jgi:hypothetical protein
MVHIKYAVPFFRGLSWRLPTDLRRLCSFKLHATARRLHDWTRSEKKGFKEERAARTEDYSEKGANPSSYTEKPLSTEAEEDGEV